jgi:hypothetical protein
MTWDAGSVYPATLAITDATGSPVNPSTATLTITLPDQTTQTPAITLPPATTGLLVYNFASSASLPGLYKFAWATTGPVVNKTDYVSFRSFVSAISLQDARDRLGLKTTANDEKLRTYMAAATREVEKITGTLVPRVFTDDWIPGTYRDVLRVPHGPILNASAVTSLASVYPFGPSWSGSQLIVNPYPGIIRLSGLIPFWYGPWKATYTAGVTEIPEPVAEGIKEVVFDLWSSQRGMRTDITEAAAADTLQVPPYYRLPPRALEFIKGYELPGFG